MRSVVFVAGARPNFMKIAPLLRAIAPAAIRVELVHTGQHHDRAMSGSFFDELGIRAPDHELGIFGAQTEKIQQAFGDYLDAREAPRGVVVVGDVSSTMACALAAATRGIAVAHVEAGLRSYDRTMPEETHRIVTDSVSELLFASEPAAIENLALEGRRDAHLVGNVMIDTLVAQLDAARALEMAARFEVEDYVIATLHRPSNVDDPLQLAAVVEMLCKLAGERTVIFPVHPRTRAQLRKISHPRVVATDPLGYREFLGLVDGARCVVTDSGGIQEETTFLGVPCFTLRSTTERPCTISHGTNTLVKSLAEVPVLVRSATRRAPAMLEGWDGHAAERVIAQLVKAWT
jgi:UDP-N-acetylglucosamine 2-epimerase (non-hydrolysing)